MSSEPYTHWTIQEVIADAKRLRTALDGVRPLMAALAQWERENGTLAAMMNSETLEVTRIIGDWAMNYSPRTIDDALRGTERGAE